MIRDAIIILVDQVLIKLCVNAKQIYFVLYYIDMILFRRLRLIYRAAAPVSIYVFNLFEPYRTIFYTTALYFHFPKKQAELNMLLCSG